MSEGRGTTKPFELAGAPWIDSSKLIAELRSRKLQGVLFRQAYFTPTFSKYRGDRCSGFQVHVTERHDFKPFETGLHIVDAIRKLHPERFEWTKPKLGSRCYFDTLAGTDKIRKQLCDGACVRDIIDGFQEELSKFVEIRKNYLLYDHQAPT